jgi:hypothetical protein
MMDNSSNLRYLINVLFLIIVKLRLINVNERKLIKLFFIACGISWRIFESNSMINSSR